MGGSTPVNYLAGRARYDRHFHCVIRILPRMSTCCAEGRRRIQHDLQCRRWRGYAVQALELVQRLGRPTINHPRLIMHTDRESIARRFADIPGCVIPRTFAWPARNCGKAHRTSSSRVPPAIARAGRRSARRRRFRQVRQLEGYRRLRFKSLDAHYYLIEYINYRSDDGFFRKYRIIFLDGEIMPYHLAIHDDWKVHHFRTDMANHAWMRKEEEWFLSDIGNVFDAAHQDALLAMARATDSITAALIVELPRWPDRRV